MAFLGGIKSALHGAGLPYGYTITIFSSGQVLTAQVGMPGIGQTFLFALGAVTGYGALRIASMAAEPVGHQLAQSPHPVRAGAFHVSAIGLAIGAAALLGMLGDVAWPLAGLVATVVYLLLTGAEMGLQGRRDEGPDA